jgi:hypothetical protein
VFAIHDFWMRLQDILSCLIPQRSLEIFLYRFEDGFACCWGAEVVAVRRLQSFFEQLNC